MGWRALRQNLVVLAVSIALSLVIAFVLLVAAELLFFNPVSKGNSLSVWSEQPLTVFDQGLGWRVAPNLSVWSSEKSYSSDSIGSRGLVFESSKEQILVIGDSTVWGYGVGDRETFPYYLDEIVEREDPKIQALNLGVMGYGIDQYYLYLKEKIGLVRSRLVIITLSAGNDFMDTSADNVFLRSKPYFGLREGQLVNLNSNISRNSCFNLLSSSKVFNTLDYTFRIKRFFCGGRYHTRKETEELIKRLLAEMRAVAEQHDARIMFVLSPNLNDYVEESLDLRSIRAALAEGGYDYIDYFMEVRKSGIDAGSLYIVGDTDHYTPEGNRRLAEAVFGHIEEEGLLR